MGRVSLGIILDGNPNCAQKKKLWIRITEIICSFGFIPAGITAVIFIIIAFREDSVRYFYVGAGFIFAAAILLILMLLWDDKHKCEYCGHFLTLRRISNDQFVDSTEKTVSQKVYDHDSGFVMGSRGDSAYYTSLSSHREYGKEVTKRYAYNVRCTCCGAVCKVERTKTSQHY